MRVLVVEDDRALGQFVQKLLALEGHETEWVEDGEAALARVESAAPDLIVLDLGLPRLDGKAVLQALQARGVEAAVLVLTGRTPVEERVQCLNLGADDYLQKPFSLQELTARCRAILRRRSRSATPVLRFGSLEMNLVERRVYQHGIPVALTSKEFALLEFLMRKRGGCCTRGDLLSVVWKMTPDTATNVVDVYINYLRRKLTGDCGAGPGLDAVIETVRGTGYRLRTLPARVATVSACGAMALAQVA